MVHVCDFVATIIGCITQPMTIGAVSILGFTLTVLVGVVDIKTAVQGLVIQVFGLLLWYFYF